MAPIKIAWEKEVTARIEGDLRVRARPDELARIVAKVEGQPNPCYRLSDDVLIEIPFAEWRHGDVLTYLPEPGWLVRRNYVDYWYVDMGVVRAVGDGLYCWTDLWLDVTLNQDASRYHVLDAGELADAVDAGAVAPTLLVRALRSFDASTDAIRTGAFPSRQLLEAESTAQRLRAERAGP